MKTKKILWFCSYILIIVLPSIIYVSYFHNLNPILIIAGILGITSYVLLAFQFLLASRIKIIDRCFGMDKIYRFHMILAVLAIIFAFLHKIFKEMYYSESFKTQLGDAAFFIFVGISVFSILMMINRLFFKIKLADDIRSFLNKTIKIKYQYKVMIHNITLIGLILLILHILQAYSVTPTFGLKGVLVLYFIIPVGGYFYHKLLKNFFFKSKRYLVSDIINEASNIITIRFKPAHGQIFSYLPGQFLYLRVKNPDIPGDEHPFTISSSPTDKEYISVTVKSLGDFTGQLSHIKIGDRALIDGPFGTFSYLNAPGKNLCFIAGGIGITPFLGMIRHMRHQNTNNKIVMLWGIKDSSELIAQKELEEFASSNKNFVFVPVYSDDENYSGEKGFISKDIINKYVGFLPAYEFYICGPPVMLEKQLHNLEGLDVSKKKIHFERFSM